MTQFFRPARAAAFALIVSLLAGCGSLPAPRGVTSSDAAPAHDAYYLHTFPQ